MSESITDAAELALVRHIDDHFEETLEELGGLVSIESVAWPGFDHAEVHRSAEYTAELLRSTGVFDVVDVRRAPNAGTEGTESPVYGQPAVVARRAPRNGAQTVLLYAHHDVQPPGDPALWNSPIFEAHRANGRLYGRGVADDKAGVLAHVAAIRALVATLGPDFDLGLSIFIEGEEEAGSRSFGNLLRENKELFESDIIVVADSVNWDVDTAAITVALRGGCSVNLRVDTMDHATHSGIYGGAIPDAMLATIRLLDTLWDEDGSVAVEGLKTTEIPAPPYDEARLREESGLLDGVSTIGRGPILSRTWSQPSITVTGIDAPSVQNASNTLTPSVRVRISARVAPGQDPTEYREALLAHLHANTPFGAKLIVESAGAGPGFMVDTSGPAVAALRAALEDGFDGVAPVDIGIGGSIPFISTFVEEFPRAEILVTGVQDPDTRAHSPNESLHLESYRKALKAEAIFLARVNRGL